RRSGQSSNRPSWVERASSSRRPRRSGKAGRETEGSMTSPLRSGERSGRADFTAAARAAAVLSESTRPERTVAWGPKTTSASGAPAPRSGGHDASHAARTDAERSGGRGKWRKGIIVLRDPREEY